MQPPHLFCSYSVCHVFPREIEKIPETGDNCIYLPVLIISHTGLIGGMVAFL